MTSAYALLDDPQHWAVFSKPDKPLTPTDAETSAIWESQVVVQGMHCAACALNVQAVLCSVPGVQQAIVNGATHRGRRVVWFAVALAW